MKRYVIGTYYAATEKNINFSGEKQTVFYGKEEKNIGEVENMKPAEALKVVSRVYWDAYLFKTKAAATNALKVHNENNAAETGHGFWTVTSTILEVEI